MKEKDSLSDKIIGKYYVQLEYIFSGIAWLLLGILEYYYLSWEVMAALSFIFSIMSFLGLFLNIN